MSLMTKILKSFMVISYGTKKRLAKYLYTKWVDNSLKMQKILFFIRYEELLNKTTNDSYFEQNYNFEVWIMGQLIMNHINLCKCYF